MFRRVHPLLAFHWQFLLATISLTDIQGNPRQESAKRANKMEKAGNKKREGDRKGEKSRKKAEKGARPEKELFSDRFHDQADVPRRIQLI